MFYLLCYYLVGRYLPNKGFPIIGLLCMRFRAYLCRHIFAHCGNNINVQRMVYFGSGTSIKMGNNSGIGAYSHIPPDLEIGDNVMMGPKCYFLRGNHSFRDKTRPMIEQGLQANKKTVLGNDIWIGREVLFTPGRTVADGTVIAARTVVCKDFESYSIIGGNPARIIGFRE